MPPNRGGASKYDYVKVRVWLRDPRTTQDAAHYYVLSRFLVSRALAVTQMAYRDAIRLALELKKQLVDAQTLDLSQLEMEAALFSLMRASDYGGPYIRRFRMMSAFNQQRVPLVILVGGTGLIGKSTVATLLAERLNLPNVLQTELLHSLLVSTHRAAEPPRKAQSVSEKYRARLKELLAELTPSRRHAYFVKCVKPNAELRPRAPQPAAVLRQLQRQGVLQGVALIKRGFPHRIGYADVHRRYAPLLQRLGDSGQPHLAKLAALPPRALVEAVLASQGLHTPAEYVLGRERVFLRLGKAALLEKMLARPPEEVPPRHIVT